MKHIKRINEMVVNEGTTNQQTNDFLNDLKEMLGEEKMLDDVFAWLNENTIEQLSKWWQDELDLDGEMQKWWSGLNLTQKTAFVELNQDANTTVDDVETEYDNAWEKLGFYDKWGIYRNNM